MKTKFLYRIVSAHSIANYLMNLYWSWYKGKVFVFFLQKIGILFLGFHGQWVAKLHRRLKYLARNLFSDMEGLHFEYSINWIKMPYARRQQDEI
jgi:hypothetical protein